MGEDAGAGGAVEGQIVCQGHKGPALRRLVLRGRAGGGAIIVGGSNASHRRIHEQPVALLCLCAQQFGSMFSLLFFKDGVDLVQ